MNNVIEFPTRPTKDRTMYEREIRAGLSDEGMPQKAIDTVISNMSGFIDLFSKGFVFSINLPDNIDTNTADRIREAIERSANAGFSSFSEALVVERANMEAQNLFVSGAL